MAVYAAYLDSTACCVCFFLQNVLLKCSLKKKWAEADRLFQDIPSFRDMSSSSLKKKKLDSKLVKLLLLYSEVTCCLTTVEHVLSFLTSCSVKKFYLAHIANPRIYGCYLLSKLPVFFIIIIASALSAVTQFSSNPF